MFDYAMGRALAWALVSLGPSPGPLRGPTERLGDLNFAKYIGVVSLGRLLSLAIYVGHVSSCAGCFSGRLDYRFSLVRLRPTRLRLST